MAHLHRLAVALGLGALTSVVALSCGSDDGRKKELPGSGGAGGTTAGLGGKGGSTGGKGGSTAGRGGSTGGKGSTAGNGGATGGEGGTTGGEGGAMGGAAGATGGEGGAMGGAAGATGGEGGAMGGAGGEAGSGSLPFRLFNTGVDANGMPLAGASVDPHYTLIQSADAMFTGPDAIVTSVIADGYWVAQSSISKWIAPSEHQAYPGANPCNAMGTYVYRTTFDLTGYDPATLTIDGLWGADNTAAVIYLNGVSIGAASGGYAPLTAFTISDGFLASTNTLDFEVHDIGCPNGLRVELTASGIQPL